MPIWRCEELEHNVWARAGYARAVLEHDRVIPCGISRNPADIAYINPALVLAFPCPISTPRNHQTTSKLPSSRTLPML